MLGQKLPIPRFGKHRHHCIMVNMTLWRRRGQCESQDHEFRIPNSVSHHSPTAISIFFSFPSSSLLFRCQSWKSRAFLLLERITLEPDNSRSMSPPFPAIGRRRALPISRRSTRIYDISRFHWMTRCAQSTATSCESLILHKILWMQMQGRKRNCQCPLSWPGIARTNRRLEYLLPTLSIRRC